MSVLDHLEARVDNILSPVYDSSGHMIPREFRTAAEMRAYLAQLTQIQKSLRLLKSEVTNESKQISMNYSDKITNVSSHPIFGLLTNRKAASHLSAMDRQRHRHNRQAALAPYRNATAYIDQCISKLDSVKINLQQQMQQGMLYTCNLCGYQFTGPMGGHAPKVCPRCGR